MNRREFLKRATWSLAAMFAGLSLLRAVEGFLSPAAPQLHHTDILFGAGSSQFRVGDPMEVYRGGPVARGVVIAVSSGAITVEWS